jgi:hypothetical protein
MGEACGLGGAVFEKNHDIFYKMFKFKNETISRTN